MGIDPGGTTGFATYDCESMSWDRWQTAYRPVKLYNQINDWLAIQPLRSEPPVIICERFQYRRNRPDADLTAMKVIGIAELAAQRLSTEFHYQQASVPNGEEGDTFWTTNRVKHLGLWLTGMIHAMDATKHILYYRSFTLGENDLIKQLALPSPPQRIR